MLKNNSTLLAQNVGRLSFVMILAQSLAFGAQTIEFPILTRDGPAPPRDLRGAFTDRVDSVPQKSISELILLLQDPYSKLRETAAQQIFERADTLTNFVPQLANALTNDNVAVRRYVSASLLKIGRDSYEAAPALIHGLTDTNHAVRANCAACLGKIGPSAGFAVPSLTNALDDSSAVVRAYAAGALGLVAKDPDEVVPLLLKVADEVHPFPRQFAIKALGEFGAGAKSTIPRLAAKLKISPEDEKEWILNALANIALRLQEQDAIDAIPLLKNAQPEMRKEFLVPAAGANLAIVAQAVKYLEMISTNRTSLADNRQLISFLDRIPEGFTEEGKVAINGVTVEIADINPPRKTMYFLGEKGLLSAGLNWMKSAKAEYQFWMEESKLRPFAVPYSNSFAIVIAIDDYQRAKDKQHRGVTDYRGLSFMVDHAKELAQNLQKLGFPQGNIRELYDQDATSGSIESLLKKFWRGGELANIDRLFFYFGGHGDRFDDTGCLITYDFQASQPTLSSLLMQDLTGRHFENVVANHFMIAIDACHAGLTLPHFLSAELDTNRLSNFKTLTIIEAETQRKARNVIVSGTGEQKALWENGGIFTKALVDGLKMGPGNADLNRDGLIQFEELALFIKNQVRAQARMTKVIQDPEQWKADTLGRGSMLFITPRDSRQ